jgi:hypothetical protein
MARGARLKLKRRRSPFIPTPCLRRSVRPLLRTSGRRQHSGARLGRRGAGSRRCKKTRLRIRRRACVQVLEADHEDLFAQASPKTPCGAKAFALRSTPSGRLAAGARRRCGAGADDISLRRGRDAESPKSRTSGFDGSFGVDWNNFGNFFGRGPKGIRLRRPPTKLDLNGGEFAGIRRSPGRCGTRTMLAIAGRIPSAARRFRIKRHDAASSVATGLCGGTAPVRLD